MKQGKQHLGYWSKISWHICKGPQSYRWPSCYHFLFLETENGLLYQSWAQEDVMKYSFSFTFQSHPMWHFYFLEDFAFSPCPHFKSDYISHCIVESWSLPWQYTMPFSASVHRSLGLTNWHTTEVTFWFIWSCFQWFLSNWMSLKKHTMTVN